MRNKNKVGLYFDLDASGIVSLEMRDLFALRYEFSRHQHYTCTFACSGRGVLSSLGLVEIIGKFSEMKTMAYIIAVHLRYGLTPVAVGKSAT